jgi:signal transduction histidine kinase
VTVELGRADGRVEIRVRDRGIGIPPEDLGRIFENFFRANEASRVAPQGAGLGLKIVMAIMEAHNGEVGVESKPGQGSTFRLIFPEA